MAGRARVLIVDDEPFNVDLLEQELELLDCATVAAADGYQALQRLVAEPIDLVLLDIMMPKLDGYQALRRIKADPAAAAHPGDHGLRPLGARECRPLHRARGGGPPAETVRAGAASGRGSAPV